MFKKCGDQFQRTRRNLVLQSDDGTVRVAIWPGKVKVTAPEVDVVAPIVDIKASTSITLDTPLVIATGNLSRWRLWCNGRIRW